MEGEGHPIHIGSTPLSSTVSRTKNVAKSLGSKFSTCILVPCFIGVSLSFPFGDQGKKGRRSKRSQ